jgi:hypothetical protein
MTDKQQPPHQSSLLADRDTNGACCTAIRSIDCDPAALYRQHRKELEGCVVAALGLNRGQVQKNKWTENEGVQERHSKNSQSRDPGQPFRTPQHDTECEPWQGEGGQ